MAATRTQRLFCALVLGQAAHSIEEWAFRLWDSLPPARLISAALSDDLERGFILFNVSIFLFGLWCFFWPVRSGWPSARTFMWGWAIVEIANPLGFLLARELLRDARRTAGAVSGVDQRRR